MTEDNPIDRDTLTSRTVAQLREICKKRGLMVSGKKSELVDRILDNEGIRDTVDEEEQEDWEHGEALLMEEDEEDVVDIRSKVSETLSKIGNVVEAEVVQAEVVEAGQESEQKSEPKI